MTREKRVSVIGAADCGPELAETARLLGRLLAQRGFTLVCGGLGGVMTAAARGAREAGGRTVGILPGLDRSAANPYIELPLVTGLGPMRNFLVVANGDVAVAVEGGSGTLSEIGLALKIGRPVVGLGRWASLPGVCAVDTPEEAAAAADRLCPQTDEER